MLSKLSARRAPRALLAVPARLQSSAAAAAPTDSAGCALLLTAVLPDAEGTAAGVRTVSLLKSMRAVGLRPLIAVTSSLRTEDAARRARTLLERYGAHTVQVAVNDPSFDAWLRDVDSGAFFAAHEPTARLTRWQPSGAPVTASSTDAPRGYLSAVVFNEFAVEEQFSWRVAAAAPLALRIVDTQDLHGLRAARAAAVAAADRELARSSVAKLAPFPAMQAMVVPDVLAPYAAATEASSNGFAAAAAAESIAPVSLASPSCALALPLPVNDLPFTTFSTFSTEIRSTGSSSAGEVVFAESNADTGADAASAAAGALALREAASLHRSDLALFVSRVEVALATAPSAAASPVADGNAYSVSSNSSSSSVGYVSGLGLPACKAAFVPITLPPEAALSPAEAAAPERTHGARRHFVFIGTGKHAPNLDAVELLRRGGLWDRIRDRCEALQQRANADTANGSADTEPVELHVYGSHLPLQLSAAAAAGALPRGLRVLGFAPAPLAALLARYRVLLCPVRFGAGVKGKVLDAWAAHTPVAATSVGAEDLCHDYATGATDTAAFGGVVSDCLETGLPDAAAALYCDAAQWAAASARRAASIKAGHTDHAAAIALRSALIDAGFAPYTSSSDTDADADAVSPLRPPSAAAARALRGADLVGRMLWGSAFRATESRARALEARAELLPARAEIQRLRAEIAALKANDKSQI